MDEARMVEVFRGDLSSVQMAEAHCRSEPTHRRCDVAEADLTPFPTCFHFSGNSGSTLALKGAMFNKKNSFGSFALTFALGAVAGAAVALLFAPMTGRKMQKKVADATERVKDVVEDSVDNVQNLLRKVAKA
ncbi:MAG: YtxH domain-containing protein [Thermoanaerobaculia bacterium]